MSMKSALFGAFAGGIYLFAAVFFLAMFSPAVETALFSLSDVARVLLGCLALIAWLAYLWDVWRNPRMPKDKRALWTAVLILANLYALPFYWWFYIREVSG
jgi:hypothetical protein